MLHRLCNLRILLGIQRKPFVWFGDLQPFMHYSTFSFDALKYIFYLFNYMFSGWCQNGYGCRFSNGRYWAVFGRAFSRNETTLGWHWRTAMLFSFQWISAEWFCEIVSLAHEYSLIYWYYRYFPGFSITKHLTIGIANKIILFQFLGWSRQTWSKRIPANRTRYSSDACKNHRNSRSPLLV